MNILDGIPEEKLTAERETQLAALRDDDSINCLIVHNLREAFLYGAACYQSLEPGETLSACYDGLRKAALRFAPNRIRFFAYAKADIRGALCKLARTRDVVKRGPRELEGLPDPDPAEDPEDTIVFRCETQDSTQPDFEGINTRELWTKIAPALSALNPEESMVLRLHFLGGLSLREIGDMLDLSRERIRQIKNEALRKTRSRLK